MGSGSSPTVTRVSLVCPTNAIINTPLQIMLTAHWCSLLPAQPWRCDMGEAICCYFSHLCRPLVAAIGRLSSCHHRLFFLNLFTLPPSASSSSLLNSPMPFRTCIVQRGVPLFHSYLMVMAGSSTLLLMLWPGISLALWYYRCRHLILLGWIMFTFYYFLCLTGLFTSLLFAGIFLSGPVTSLVYSPS